jgi:Tautomerase enzyme
MPAALIEVRRRYSTDEESAIVDTVHGALVTAFHVPPEDRTVRLVVHEPHRFACSPRLTEPERFTLVTIDCFAGRSVDAKRALYTRIVDGLAALGVPRNHVTVTLRESVTPARPGGAVPRAPSPPWIDCELRREYDGGEHTIVVRRVTDLGAGASRPPLFHRGRHGALEGRIAS